jgi:hypothetical protein
MSDLKSDFQKQWNSVGVYHAKALIKDLPNWEDILNILNGAIRDENPKIPLQSRNDFEIIYKDLFAIKKFSPPDKTGYGQVVESDATFFFSLFFTQETINTMIPDSIKDQIENINEMLDINAHYRSLKIALSDKFVPYESHENGHTCIIQLAGSNVWNLRDKDSGMQKTHVLEPGDVLLFKEKIEHELTNEGPRSSLVGFFDLGDSHER